MNVPINRTFVSQVVIVASICVGAWSMLVKPQLEEMAKLEGEIAESAALPPGLEQTTVQEVAGRLNALHVRVADIQQRNALATDTSKLYGLLTNLAERHGVHVQSLQPGVARPGASKDAMTVGRIELTVEGPYDRVAWFVGGINDLQVFIRPESLHLGPVMMMGRQLVTARLGFDVLRFELSPALTTLGDAVDAKR